MISVIGVQTSHQKGQYGISVSHTAYASCQLSQKSDSDLQESLQGHLVWSGRLFPTPSMGQTSPTSRNDTKYAATIQHFTSRIYTHVRFQSTWLQCQSARATRVRSTNQRTTRGMQDLGSQFNWWMVHRTSNKGCQSFFQIQLQTASELATPSTFLC
jgi:hypothetical protein